MASRDAGGFGGVPRPGAVRAGLLPRRRRAAGCSFGSRAPGSRASPEARPSRARREGTSRPRRRQGLGLARARGCPRRHREGMGTRGGRRRSRRCRETRSRPSRRRRALRRPSSRRRRPEPRRPRGLEGRSCASPAVKRSSSDRLETHADDTVEHADRRRHRSCLANGRLARETDLDPVRRREPVRDQRGLERDDRIAGVERRAHLLADDDELAHEPTSLASGIAPTCCTQRAAASSARSGPPTIHPAASASPAPVVSTTRETGRAARSSPSKEHPRAPRFAIHCTPGSGPPKISSSRSVAKTTSGASCVTVSRSSAGPASRMALQVARSTLDRGSLSSRDLDGALRGAPGGLVQERVPRDEEVVAAFEPRRIELVLAKLARRSAVGRHRALAVRGDERADHAVSAFDRPERPGHPSLRVRRSASRPASSSPRFAIARELAPSVAAQAATFAA